MDKENRKNRSDRNEENTDNETTRANLEIQEAFYEEEKKDGAEPANLNNQTAILPEED